MAKRKPMSRTVRFEVFKRDRFTCQYCGSKAPNVVLNVDHIKPVAEGGTNDVMNLVTACESCNGGKGARQLDDMSVVERQRQQLEELEERRQQLEMMLKWRDGLSNLEGDKLDAIVQHIGSKSNFVPNENGKRNLRTWLKKFTLEALLDAADQAFDQYMVFASDGKATAESWTKAFNMIPRIIGANSLFEKKPYMRELFYIRGILRNRLTYVNEQEALRLMEEAHLLGTELDELKQLAKNVRNWSEFNFTVQREIQELKAHA